MKKLNPGATSKRSATLPSKSATKELRPKERNEKQDSSSPSKATQLLEVVGIGQISTLFPKNDVLECLSVADSRDRDLPLVFIVYYIILLAFYRGLNYVSVYKRALSALVFVFGRQGGKEAVTDGAISKRRAKVGVEPLRKLFDRCCVAVGKPTESHSYWKRWHLFAFDGSTKATVDSEQNDEDFARSKNQSKNKGLQPLIRWAALMEIGTRLFIGLEVDSFEVGETTLVKRLFSKMKAGGLYIVDRLLYSFDLMESCKRSGADALARVRLDVNFYGFQRLADGSYLAYVFASNDRSKKNPLVVRVIDARIKVGKTKQKYRLVTTIMDYNTAPAEELVKLYRQRWEIESAFDEIKTHLDLSCPVLRSKIPALVKQEVYGLFMAHYVVRRTMNAAAARENIDPDELSFTHSIEVIRSKLPMRAASLPPETSTTTA